MKKKTFCFLLCFVMLFSLLPGIDLTASAADWTGYTAISSQSDLAAMGGNLSGKYYLTRNITITGSWSGIGSSASPFTGVFDGNGKIITFSGVTVTGTSAYTGSLFNYVSGTFSGNTSSASSWTAGIVRNVTVVNPIVTSAYEYTGGVIGFLYNAHVGEVIVKNANVSSSANFASGMIGGSDGTNLVEKCFNGTYRTAGGETDGATVVCTGGHSCSGGIVGMAFGDSYVKECYNYGSVWGTHCNGGIVGHLEGSATVRNCINYGPVTSSPGRAGGIVGAAVPAEMSTGGGSKGYETIENCANFGTVTAGIPVGICAYGSSSFVRISNCYTVNRTGIYLGDGRNFIALYSSGSSTVSDAYMKAPATSDYDGTTVSFTSLVDQLNGNVMNAGVNKTISTNIAPGQTDAGDNQWFFWKIDTNEASPSYGYPVFSNSFTPTSRSGIVNAVTLNTNGGTVNSGNVTEYTTGTEVTLPTNVTKGSDTFGGWYDNAGFSGSAVTKISADDFGDKIFYAKWLQQNTYEINGKVEDDSAPPSPISAATVKLMRGQNQIGATIATGSDGRFTVSNLPNGTYNLVISNGEVTVTTLVEIKGGDKAMGNIVLPFGKKSSIVEVKNDTPPVVIGNLDAQFDYSAAGDDTGITDADKEVIDAGGSVELKFTAQQMGGNQAANAGNIQVTAQSDNKTVGAFLDFSVYKTVTPFGGEPTTTKLTELPDLIQVLIPLDASLQGKTDYVIYRYHGTEVNAITTNPNEDGEYLSVNADKTEITLYIRKFSTYAIAFDPSSDPVIPSTGDKLPEISLFFMGLGSLAALLVLRKKRSSQG